ncbi:cathepsin O-like [Mercenaria mercenaria]|uniref:cathepsin O-like n=1 Tax=Mercenaria mercenaria TaxID=6596 RepID=UPI00234F5012|nr:cathepsin O-like [Mercenaria mercenaria]
MRTHSDIRGIFAVMRKSCGYLFIFVFHVFAERNTRLRAFEVPSGTLNTRNSSNVLNRFYVYNHYKDDVGHHRSLANKFKDNGAKNGLTKFSDLSFAEFKELYLSDLQPSVKPFNHTRIIPVQQLRKLPIPDRLDWRTYLNYSIISPVKNQKKCGGCWAFSTVETVESMVAKATGNAPPNLSVQQVIDCASNNAGCEGGDTCRALSWMVDSKTPLVSDALYPLTDESNFCKIEPNDTKGTQVKDYQCYKHVSEDKVLQLLQGGPLVAAVDATTWYNYQGGVIQYHCDAFVNHAVQIVGYDLSGEVPYYIVRNSWGADFGHDGFLYIKIGENVCGIASEISTVLVYA